MLSIQSKIVWHTKKQQNGTHNKWKIGQQKHFWKLKRLQNYQQGFTAANINGLKDLKENMNVIREIEELKICYLKVNIHWTDLTVNKNQ